MKTPATLVLLAGFALSAWSQDPSQQPLRVRKIVAYKHGVGYFEREGTVTGDQTITLWFKSGQMKDLLKSFYAVDLSGGRISSVSYDTKDPMSKQLEDILIRVPEEHALTRFLTQLQGAQIRVTIAGEDTVGQILGVEPITLTTEQGVITRYKLILLRDDEQIRPVDLLDASALELLDPSLRQDLQRILQIRVQAMHADRKSVKLSAIGQGERQVRVGYIIETPIWKTSYRLLMSGERPPLLQGWAILENTTDEDWDDVRVSFVAGTPISFIMDLYTAYYPRRKEIPVGLAQAPAPRAPTVRGGGRPGRGRGAPAEKARRQDLGRVMEPQGDARGFQNFDMELEKAMAPAAGGVEVGELFAYQVTEPVSVARGQAALVPILSERIENADRVLYYRPSLATRVFNACYLKNTTGLTLESGPITFFEESTCIGEGLLDRVLKQGMRAMVPYALEAGVEVETKVDGRSDPVTRGRVSQGVLTLEHVENRITTLAIRNRLAKSALVYVDQPRAQGFTLAEPLAVEDEVPGHYRFRVEVGPAKEAELQVRESRAVSSRIDLLGTPSEVIRFHLSQRYLTDRAKAFLGELATLQNRINLLKQEESNLKMERAQLDKDQERLRKNVQVLRETTREQELRSRYLQRLETADQRILEIQGELKQRIESRMALEQELARKVQQFEEK